VRWLLKYGAALYAVDKRRKTAVDYAIESKHKSIKHELQEWGNKEKSKSSGTSDSRIEEAAI
jgi:hypothetical protein